MLKPKELVPYVLSLETERQEVAHLLILSSITVFKTGLFKEFIIECYGSDNN